MVLYLTYSYFKFILFKVNSIMFFEDDTNLN